MAFLENCSEEEMQEDFSLYKKRSDNLQVKDEICQILSNSSSITPVYARPKNPFYKNFGEE